MASPVKRHSVETQAFINVSQGAVTSPAAPAVERTPPIPLKSQSNKPITRNRTDESTQVVEESIPQSHPQRQHSSLGTPVRLSVVDVPADDHVDLYESTPRVMHRKSSPDPIVGGVALQQTQTVADKLVANAETQDTGAAAKSARATISGPSLSQLFTDDLDAPTGKGTAKATPKPRLLTQTSRSDNIEPAPGASTDPPASNTSRRNSNESSTQSGQSRNVSNTSQTSAMASAAKGAVATAKQLKSQPAATGTSAKAKLEAMKAAQTDNSASATLPATGAVSAEESLSSIKSRPQAGPSSKAVGRQTTETVAVAAVVDSANQPPARPGKLPTLRKPMLPAAASAYKDALDDNNIRPENETQAIMQEDIDTTTEADKEGTQQAKAKQKQKQKQKQKVGPVTADRGDTNVTGKTSRRANVGHESQPTRKSIQHSKTVVSGKRKADGEELGGNEDTSEAVKKVGAIPNASAKNKRQKQAPASSSHDDEEEEQEVEDEEDGSEYGGPKSSAKKVSNTTKAKGASKTKAGPSRRTPQPTRTTRRQAATKDRDKVASSIDVTADAEKAGPSRTHQDVTVQDSVSKHVGRQHQKQRESVSATAKFPQARDKHIPIAAGSKAQGKKAVNRLEDNQSGLSAKTRPDPRPESNVVGGTQDDAIVLSDDDGKSSSLPGSPTSEQRTTTASHVLTAPKTPALPIRSSPPMNEDEDAAQLAQLQRTVRAHKPTFINFDKSGPRNQGVAAVKTPGTRSAKKTPVAPPSPRSKFELERRNGPSSFATSVRSEKAMQRAPSSNIALNVEDALSSLLQKQTKLPFEMSAEPDDGAVAQCTAQHLELSNVVPAEADDDDFMNIDEHGDGDYTLMQMDSAPRPAANKSTVEQEVKPATVPVKEIAATATASTKPSAKHFGEPLSEQPVISRKSHVDETMTTEPASPKQPPQKSHKPAPAKAETVVHAKEETVKPREKRSLAIAYDNKAAAKRAKVNVVDDEIVNNGTTLIKAHQPDPLPEVAASSTPQHRKTMVMAPPAVPVKPSRPGTKVLALPAEHRKPEPSRRVKGQPSRYISHNSQTVDVHGSPVPAEMVVSNTNTVLETFSQQAGVVSDQDAVEQTLKRQRTKYRAETQQPDNDLRYSVSQSHQPEPLSSNTKPVPAAPQATSTVVPRLELSHSQSEKVLTKRDHLSEMQDPFSGHNNAVVTQGSKGSVQVVRGLAEQLDEKMKRLEDEAVSEDGDEEEEEESTPTVIHTERQDPMVEANQSPLVDPDSSEDDAEISDHDVAQLRAITFLRPRHHEEDPDKTLVHDDDGDETPDYVKDAPLQGSWQAAEDLELSDPASDDLMSWRQTLKPHQLNLFQELIKTSHRLMEYFVEQENSILRNVEKAHRQNIYAIEQEEITRAKLYTAKMEELKRRKKDSKKQLKKVQNNLAERLRQKKTEKEERQARAAQWEDENENLEAMISKLS